MSEVYVSLDAQGKGHIRTEPEIRAQMREAVAAYRDKQVEQAHKGFWFGVGFACWCWLWALYGVIALRDEIASLWRALW